MKMITTSQKISAQVLAKVAEGMDVVDALKAVCGSYKVEQMIAEIYNSLRERV